MSLQRVRERLALRLPSHALPPDNLWVHALSVGEVLSALPLVKALARAYADRGLVFSATTSKGLALARKTLAGQVTELLAMPLDLRWCMRRVLAHIHPVVFVLVETDIWPTLLGALRKRGVGSVLVNGRVSPGSFAAYRRLPWLARLTYGRLDQCLMQTEMDRARLLELGLSPERVLTTGNIKFDREWEAMTPDEHRQVLARLGFEPHDRIWVAGSTHPGEEQALLETHRRLRARHPALRLVLAPRKIERSGELVREAGLLGLRAVRRSQAVRPGHDVLVLDTLGELARIYGVSVVSFVGGSLVPFGGHNLLEPASFGQPVLFGRHTQNFQEMAEALESTGGGLRVSSAAGLHEALQGLLAAEDARSQMGERARRFVFSNRGALREVLSRIDLELSRGRRGGR